jgi:hypothetical protein
MADFDKILTTTNVLIIISIIILISCIYYQKIAKFQSTLDNKSREDFATGDVCTVKINNLNPMFINNFKKYNGQKINCFNKLSSKAYCVGGTINVEVQPYESHSESGTGSYNNVKQSVTITNSNGGSPPSNANIPLDPWGFEDFFCLE